MPSQAEENDRLREIDAKIAYHLDKWRWVKALDIADTYVVMLQPPKDGKEYERTLMDQDCTELEGWDVPYPRSRFWFAQGGRFNTRKGLYEYGFQHYTSDPASARRVKEWLLQERYLVIQKEMPDGECFWHDITAEDLPGIRCVAQIYAARSANFPSKLTAHGKTGEEALCNLALLLLEIRKEKGPDYD